MNELLAGFAWPHRAFHPSLVWQAVLTTVFGFALLAYLTVSYRRGWISRSYGFGSRRVERSKEPQDYWTMMIVWLFVAVLLLFTASAGIVRLLGHARGAS